MEIDLRNTKGEVVRSVEVRDDVFNVPMNTSLVHQVMVAQLANRRQGTSKTKTRAHVSGGGAKPRPQKYTGRARQGSIRSPQWKGGGIVFGPVPRSYRQKVAKRVRRQSIKIMLSDKARSGQLVVLENLDLAQAKTKEMAGLLDALEAGRSVLLVADGASELTIRAARNIPNLKTSPASMLNTVDLLNARKVVMTLDAVHKAEELWGGPFIRRKDGSVIVVEPSEADEEESVEDDEVLAVSDQAESVDEEVVDDGEVLAVSDQAESVDEDEEEPVAIDSEAEEMTDDDTPAAEDSVEQPSDEEADEETKESRE